MFFTNPESNALSFTGPRLFCEGSNFLSLSKNVIAFMRCPFTDPKKFWAGPIFLYHTKNWFTYHASPILFVSDQKMIFTHALSFYRSQNVFGWSKYFVPDQKFIYILRQSQIYCARQKDDLHSVKLVFVPAQKFCKRH